MCKYLMVSKGSSPSSMGAWNFILWGNVSCKRDVFLAPISILKQTESRKAFIDLLEPLDVGGLSFFIRQELLINKAGPAKRKLAIFSVHVFED